MIPKLLHQFWTGPPMPKVYQEFTEKWRKLHPEWEVIVWGQERELPLLINQTYFDRAAEICPNYVGQLTSDILRLELLYLYGGVWVDTDCEPLKPLDPLLVDVECFMGWTNPNQWLNNAVMGAVPAHSFVELLINELPDSIDRNAKAAPRVISGPQFITPLWRKHPEGVTIFPKDYFFPYLWSELGRDREEFPESYVVHHWHNRRRERKRPLNR